jgi:hypothetical protein
MTQQNNLMRTRTPNERFYGTLKNFLKDLDGGSNPVRYTTHPDYILGYGFEEDKLLQFDFYFDRVEIHGVDVRGNWLNLSIPLHHEEVEKFFGMLTVYERKDIVVME